MSKFIYAAERNPDSGFYEFQKDFESDADCTACVKIFAETRYILFINDTYVCEGPCRSSLEKGYYDRINSVSLKKGKNRIRVLIMFIRDRMSFSTVRKSDTPSLLFSMEGEGVSVYSDESWKLYKQTSHTFEGQERLPIPPFEIESFPRTYSELPVDVGEGNDFVHDISPYGVCPKYQLEERPIPMIVPGDPVVIVPQNVGEGFAEYDFGSYVTAKVRVRTAKHTEAKIIYAECRETEQGKGIRDDKNGFIRGNADRIRTEEAEGDFTTFWFRAFRFIRIETEDPADILEVSAMPCHYPLDITAEFDSSEASYRRMFEVSIHTLLCCMHEIYVDCPYYEQQQYVMDSAIECAVTAVLSRDRRMLAKCISEFAASQEPSGFIHANYPADYTQIIPGFSFFFVFLLRSYLDLSHDDGFVKRYVPTVDKIFCCFDSLLSEDRLIHASEKWDFVDWVPEWWCGVPSMFPKETMTIYNLYYLAALKDAEYICEKLGRKGLLQEYREKYAVMKAALDKKMLDPRTGLYRDTEHAEKFSMHGIIWAVLAGLYEGEDAKEKLGLLGNGGLLVSSFSMNFYLFKALERVGVRESFKKFMSGWESMLSMHCTTWCENPDHPRSECHAWSAAPIYVFGRFVLGVNEDYDGLTISPVVSDLRYASGKVATRFGTVSVDWKIADGRFLMTVDKSACDTDLPVTVILPSGEKTEFCEKKREFSCIMEQL